MAGEHLQAGIDCEATLCTTPRMIPPASVPQKLDRPPMMTASKPKISRVGPVAGSKLARIASNTPASPTIASDRAHRQPEHMAVVEPHQLRHPRIVRLTARNARPIAVR